MNNELTHYGVLGMKWGVRRYQNKNGSLTSAGKRRLSYKDRSKNKYLEKGYSEKDAENLAIRKNKIRNTALIAGGITVAVGAAFVARHYYVENKDILLKTGDKTFHIDRDVAKDLEEGRHLYVTIDQLDRKAYQWRLNNPINSKRIERVFEMTKDVKVPSPKKAKELFEEFKNDSDNNQKIKQAFSNLHEEPDYSMFLTVGPYFSEDDKSFGGIGKLAKNNKPGVELWKEYKNFIIDKGYHGLLDENDRNPLMGFNVERPAIIFDAASKLKETSRKNIKDPGISSLIPTVREIGSLNAAKKLTAIAGYTGYTTMSNTKLIEEYRLKYPNSKMTDRKILQYMYKNYKK